MSRFLVGRQGCFEWPFVVVEVALTCDRCGKETLVSYPALADWRDRETSADQRRAADGHSCDQCGRLMTQPTPLLQYRRGDVIGLVVGFPPRTATDDDRKFIQDTLTAAHELDLTGAGVVVSARMSWWGSIYNRPLGPDLIADLETPLPESAEETERWKTATVAALDLPDVARGLADFVTAEGFGDALDVVRATPALVDPNWSVTVHHLEQALRRHQEHPDAEDLVTQRAGRLRQVQLVGVDGADNLDLVGDAANLVDTAIGSSRIVERRRALQRAVAGLDQEPATLITGAVHTSLVAALLSEPDRDLRSHHKVLTAAVRALAVADEVGGAGHELTLQATLNLAVAIEEDPNPRDELAALAEARVLLEGVAPVAASAGSPIVADIATNLATIAAREGSRADSPERTRELLDDAAHLRLLLTVEGRRSELVALVDTAATLRSRIVGNPADNTREAVALLDEAQARNEEWQLLSEAETVLLAGNYANAVHQLHTHEPTGTSDEARIAASFDAISATERVARLHPVAIEALNNAGSILIDAYSDSLRAGSPKTELWDLARTNLEDARTRAAEAFPNHHLVTLRIAVNLGTVYGRLRGQSIADPERSADLFRYVIDHCPEGHDEYALTAATNLGQLAMGQGEWQRAEEAYAIAGQSAQRLINGARTRITTLGEILLTADVSIRRALALTSLGELNQAIEVLVANRTRLSPTPRPVAPDASNTGAATVHVASCDYGSFAIVTSPDGHQTGFRSPLASTEVKAGLAAVLTSATIHDRENNLDALNDLLRVNLVEPLNLLLAELPEFTELRLIAAGGLTSCPLSVVPGDNGQMWIDRWKIENLVAGWQGEDQPLPPNPKALAVIDPDATLAFAESEAEALNNFAGNVATPPPDWSVRDWVLNNLSTVAVAHLACHASLDPNDPTRSAFHLGETVDLTVEELAELELPALHLVVAPACQSAASSPTAPDELLGVAHALLHAGAKGVIASLWDADDDATALVVAKLYHGIGNGLAPGEGLAQSQLFVRNASAGSLIELAKRRLSNEPDADWLPYHLALEFAARSAHPLLGLPDQRWFEHPARWAALSYIRN